MNPLYSEVTAPGDRCMQMQKISWRKFPRQLNRQLFCKQHSPLPCLFIPQGHGACFSADEDVAIQATVQTNEVEFRHQGSTILAISDMPRTQSSRIK